MNRDTPVAGLARRRRHGSRERPRGACRPVPRTGGARASPYPAETAKAEQAMNELQQALLATLRSAMEAGGPAAAVDVCRTEARTIAEGVALKQGIELGRTSHRVRNPANAPRPWARAIVEGSAGAKAAAGQIRVVDLGERVGVLDQSARPRCAPGATARPPT